MWAAGASLWRQLRSSNREEDQHPKGWLWRVSRYLGLLPVSFQSCRCAPSRMVCECPCAVASKAWLRYSLSLVFVLAPLSVLGLALEFRDVSLGQPSLRMANKADGLITSCDILTVTMSSAVSVFQAAICQDASFKLLEQLRQVDARLSAPPPAVPRWLACWLLTLLSVVIMDVCVWTELKKGLLYHASYLPFYLLYITAFVSEALFVDDAHSIYVRFGTINEMLRTTFCVPTYVEARTLRKDVKDLHVLGHDHLAIRQNLNRKTSVPPSVRTSMSSDSTYGEHYSNHQLARIGAWQPGGAGGAGGAGGVLEVSPRVPGGPGEVLQRLGDAHSELCEAVTSVGLRYGFTLLCDMLCLLLHVLITAYFLVKNLLVSPMNVTRQYIALQCTWLSVHLGRILFLLYPCTKAKTEANRTGSLITSLLNTVPSTKVTHKQLRIFALQLLHHRVSFEACGLFELDLPLIVSILGSVTTYLVVLLQLKSPPLDNPNNSTGV